VLAEQQKMNREEHEIGIEERFFYNFFVPFMMKIKSKL